jgi:hypothetical protein
LLEGEISMGITESLEQILNFLVSKKGSQVRQRWGGLWFKINPGQKVSGT